MRIFCQCFYLLCTLSVCFCNPFKLFHLWPVLQSESKNSFYSVPQVPFSGTQAGSDSSNSFYSAPQPQDNYENKECKPPLGDICVQIPNCQFFKDLLDKTPIPRPRSIVTIIKNHQCGFENNIPKVCCTNNKPTPTASTTLPTQVPRPSRGTLSKENDALLDVVGDMYQHRNFHLLPMDICGPISNQAITNRITQGKKTSLEEFPWMVLVVYHEGTQIDFRCGATIITRTFVLTAAHCVYNSNVVGVRLGEYDISSTNQDCQGSYCAPPVQDVFIKDILVHPKYDAQSHHNDIALLKLATPANFTSNVQPICLPVSEINDDLTGKFAVVSGWGVTESGHKSVVLRKTSVPVLPITKCVEIYKDHLPVSTTKQICAGGYKGQDSCAGDSGGPLTYAGLVDGSPRFIQYGIVSYGPRDCGADPAIYTRVGNYLKWILDNLTPSSSD